jgi:hypothetical protein
VCCHYRSLQHAIRYCSKGCDVSKWVSIIRCNLVGTYVKSKRRNISNGGRVHEDGALRSFA